MKLCSIDGCGSKHFCHTWCVKHYTRWRRQGDPLIRKPWGAKVGIKKKKKVPQTDDLYLTLDESIYETF